MVALYVSNVLGVMFGRMDATATGSQFLNLILSAL